MARERTEFETEHYELIVEEGFWKSPCKGFPVYKLVNKHNGQVEGEGIALPPSIFALLAATAQYEEAIEAFKAELPPESPDFGSDDE
jgi:hypothetical protein